MASYYDLEVFTNKKIEFLTIINTIQNVAKRFGERIINISYLDVLDVNNIQCQLDMFTPINIRDKGVLTINPDKSKRNMSLFIDLFNDSISIDDEDYVLKENLQGFSILTSTRHECTIDIDAFFEEIVFEIEKLCDKDQFIVALKTDDTIDANNSVVMSGDLKNIIEGE